MKYLTRSAQGHLTAAMSAVAFVAMLAAPGMVFAQFEGADERVCGFFDNVKGLLNMASIAIVTIAIIFCGYQIAFANKRVSDVLPILLGGVLIGAAGQIARMMLSGDGGATDDCSGSGGGGGMALLAHAASSILNA